MGGLTRTMSAAVGVGLALVVVAGCGDDDSTAADPAAASSSATGAATPDPGADSSSAGNGADLPDCAEVWQEGSAVPKRYQGCLDDGAVVDADRQRCSSGQILVTFGEDYYGVEGGPVNVEPEGLDSSETYRDARRACLG